MYPRLMRDFFKVKSQRVWTSSSIYGQLELKPTILLKLVLDKLGTFFGYVWEIIHFNTNPLLNPTFKNINELALREEDAESGVKLLEKMLQVKLLKVIILKKS